ncbi:hypothetical protein ABBQ38_008811 [Trebouxia sp. C0009 RCD-2024]
MTPAQASVEPTDAAAQPARFSLNLGVKSSKAPRALLSKKDAAPANGHFVASFDPHQPAPSAAQRVIPKQADTFQGPGKPQRYLPTPGEAVVASTSDKFEAAAPEEADSTIKYGLSLQTKTANGSTTTMTTSTAVKVEPQTDSPAAPMLLPPEEDLRRFQQQLQAAAEQSTLDDYASTPIEEFGAALLRGMGWEEGKAVGRRNIRGTVPQPIEFVPRPSGLGLGANPAPAPPKKERKHIKPGESRQAKPDMVALDANGNIKNVRGLDEKLVERNSLGAKPGRMMRIVEGRHSGLSCMVLALEPHIEGRSDRATVRLLPSETTATVRCKELAEKGSSSSKETTTSRKRTQAQSDSDLSETHRVSDPSKRKRTSPSDEENVLASASSEKPWLAHHIMVKVVDKHLQGGKLYLKKAEVIEVLQPKVCTLYSRDTRKYYSNVHQSQLETVVPQEEGARVLVLQGQYKGQRARLLKRSKDAQIAVVQFLSDLSHVAKLPFDDVSHFVGEKGEEE